MTTPSTIGRSMQWTDGYYTGTEYTSGYYPNLAQPADERGQGVLD